ncbi:MAG: DUF4735 domain-containing protein [Sandaracinaceae bacterium]|nr:DUF4735 domain-containing protein [Sandaracinaceae bacterium]
MPPRAAAVALAFVLCGGCAMETAGVFEPVGGEPARADRVGPAAHRALDYLEVTDAEMGVDVVIAMQIFGAVRDDARALEVAEARRDSPRPSDLERYGFLLDIDHPAFDAGTLDGLVPSATTPDPADVLEDGRVGICLEEVLACAVTAPCIDYLELDDRWGYVLTHQAVTLLFARWVGCDLDLDVEARRKTFAVNLVAEIRADPVPSDLFYERLAMLGHLGFASAMEPAWLESLLDSQDAQGCFPLGPELPCHPHPTGVALWALAHAP